MYVYSSVPFAGTLKGFGSGKTRSGRMFQPSRNVTGAGLSFASPSTAPLSAHETKVRISASLRPLSFEKCPKCGSANHGGIFRVETAALIALAQGRVDSKVRNDIGPISPERWQFWHFC